MLEHPISQSLRAVRVERDQLQAKCEHLRRALRKACHELQKREGDEEDVFSATENERLFLDQTERQPEPEQGNQ
jgi:hypothetical protein